MNLAHQDKQFYTHFTPYWDIFSKKIKKISQIFQPPNLLNQVLINTPQKLLRSGEYMFIDVFVGWPGKCHDARVFKNSTLFENCKSSTTFQMLTLQEILTGQLFFFLFFSIFVANPPLSTLCLYPQKWPKCVKTVQTKTKSH